MFNLALIGAGRIGKIHAVNVAAHPCLNLTYVVDPSTENASAVTAATGARLADLSEALAAPEIAGVIVASSTDTHLDHCLQAHASGKAIFCEKPVDLDLARARAAAANLADARLLLGFNRRFDPSFRALKSRLASGAVGTLETLQITSNDPAPPPVSYIKVSGGLFKDMAIHDFDMARWLLNEEPAELFAWGACLVDAAIGEAGDIDTSRTMLRTASGKMAVIANSRRSGFGYDQRIEAYGANGMVQAGNMTETTVQVWGQRGAQADGFQNFFLERYQAAYRNEIDHFAAILAGREVPSVTFNDGVAALALAEAAGESLRSGRAVTL